MVNQSSFLPSFIIDRLQLLSLPIEFPFGHVSNEIQLTQFLENSGYSYNEDGAEEKRDMEDTPTREDGYPTVSEYLTMSNAISIWKRNDDEWKEQTNEQI